MLHVLVGNGHALEDLKNVYTIDQVNLFYEKQIMRDMEGWQMDAIISGNAMSYASPAWDSKSARKKTEGWSKFLDSLDRSKIVLGKKKDKPKLTVGGVMRSLGVTNLVKIKEGEK